MDRQRIRQLALSLCSCALFLSLGCGGDTSGSDPDYLPPELAGAGGATFDALGFDGTIQGNDWITQLLFASPDRSDPRLPSYTYFQGLAQAGEHIVIAGQVRVVGGVLGADSGVGSLYAGAMVTTNPYAFTGAEGLVGGPPGIRTRVGHWEELPGPEEP